MAHAVIGGSTVATLDARKELIEAKPDRFESSSDPAIVFARDLLPSLNQLRQRTRILNEKLLRNRSAFERPAVTRSTALVAHVARGSTPNAGGMEKMRMLNAPRPCHQHSHWISS